MERVVRLGLCLVVALAVACAHGARMRQTYYPSSFDELAAVTEQVIRAHYPITRAERRTDTYGEPVISYEVRLAYDAAKRRIEPPPGAIPDGVYRIRLFVSIRGNAMGRYLDITPHVQQRREGAWRPYSVVGPSLQHGEDVYSHDSWLASIVDPIYDGVRERLAAAP